MTSSFAPTCDPDFGGDHVYLRNNVCTPYRVAASVYGMKISWEEGCDTPAARQWEMPADITKPCKPLISSLRDYAVEQGFMTLEEALDLCYIDDDEW